MGDRSARSTSDGNERRAFMRSLLDDLRALEQILRDRQIESGVRRIGAEQELFLVDRSWRPAPAATELLEKIDDRRFTTELGLFNLEINLDPLPLTGSALSDMQRQLDGLLGRLREVAAEIGVEAVLAGILPTIRKADLGLDNMTPLPRYDALNKAMTDMRGGAYEFHIKGLDELLLKHDSVMLEACNASFQVHFQVDPDEFANLYNIVQVLAGPMVAAGANSPLLFGRRLWQETRIALFQQAVDTRSSMHFLRERSPRVTFGRQWVRHSVLELFQEDIARFCTLVTSNVEHDSLAAVARGEVPRLTALNLFNSTVYRWNRVCYGITEGQPHLRIENRVLPSGPTTVDQVANAAFWFGLISTLAHKIEDVTQLIAFEDASMNFIAAARLGLGAQFSWLNGEIVPAVRLICDQLVPMAREGLSRLGLDDADADHYIGVLDRRVSSHRTGAQWTVNSLTDMQGRGTLGERLNALTAAMVDRQKKNLPVSEWEPAQYEEGGGWQRDQLKVEHYMTSDLYTVQEHDSLDLIASLMDWRRIRHIPVEDPEHRLVGLISYRTLLRLMTDRSDARPKAEVAASEIMHRDPVTIDPEASILLAIETMRKHRIACLPVVKGGRLMGMFTEKDVMHMAAGLLDERLRGLGLTIEGDHAET